MKLSETTLRKWKQKLRKYDHTVIRDVRQWIHVNGTFHDRHYFWNEDNDCIPKFLLKLMDIAYEHPTVENFSYLFFCLKQTDKCLMDENIAYLVNTYVVSEERAKDLIEKHPALSMDDIADEEGLDRQIWMDEEDVARENCE